MSSSPELDKAISNLMSKIGVAGEAQIKADTARENGTMTFDIASAHRAAEANAMSATEQAIAAYVKARNEGLVTLGGSDEQKQDGTT